MPETDVIYGTYGFNNIVATITGPGGTYPLGAGAGAAEEGITIEPDGDKVSKTVGADGSVMLSLHADQSGRVVIRLQKISPTNALLGEMYNKQITNSLLTGVNIVVVTDIARGDRTSMRTCAFARPPTINYRTDPGGIMEWVLIAGEITRMLGSGVVSVRPAPDGEQVTARDEAAH